MSTDLEIFSSMLLRAKIKFKVDGGEGWDRRIVLDGDRCFVFATDGSLAGIRSEDDCQSYDGD